MQESADGRCMQVLVKDKDLSKFTKDHLLNYLENIWDCSVTDLEFSSEGSAALISFSEAQDFAALRRKCAENPLEKMVLEVKRTFEGGIIMVCNPHLGTKDESFLYYFKNARRSGGDGSAQLMERDPAHKFLLVCFSSKTAAEKCLQREHTLEDIKLELKAFNPDMDTLPSEEQPEQIQGNPAPSGEECFHNRDLKCTLNSEDDSAPHSESQKQQQKDEELNTKFTRYVKGMHRVYCGIIDVLSEVDSGIFQDVIIRVEADMLLVQGDNQALVENIDNLLKNLVKIQESSEYLAKVEEFTEWDEVFRRIKEELDGDDYDVQVRDGLVSDGSTREEFCVKTSKGLISIDQMLNGFLTREDISLAKDEEKELVNTTEWERFVEYDLEEEYGSKVYAVCNKAKSAIMVFAPQSLINKAKEYVKQFLCNSQMTESVEVTAKEHDFLQSFRHEKLEELQVQTGADNVTIKFESGHYIISGFREGVRRASSFLKKFHKDFRYKREVFRQVGLRNLYHTEEWEHLIESVSRKTRCTITDLPDGQILCEDEDSESWGLKLASVVKSYSLSEGCLVHLVDGKVTSMKVDAILLCQTHRDTDSRVSGTAVCTSHFNGKGARPKTQSVRNDKGSVHIIQSGDLPCRAIIQAGFGGESSLEEDCLRTLIYDVVSAAQMNNFTTLAIPAIGVDDVDECQKPMAIHAASKAIVSGIFSYFHSDWVEATVDVAQSSRQKNSIAHIFLCSDRPACLRAFEFQLDFEQPAGLQTVIEPPDPMSHQFVACEEDSFHEERAGVRNKLHRNMIQVVSGDICRVQAGAIVVPLDSDLDFDKNKVTSSLLYHGGQRVEHSLREGKSWYQWKSEEIDKRVKDFENEGILEGIGGSLNTNYVFYLNLPPWGPGASKILQELVEKSLRNADKHACKSVAFTTLGTGSLGYPPEVVSRIMMVTIADFLERVQSHLEIIKIVIFHGKKAEQGSMVFYEELELWYKYRVCPLECSNMVPQYAHSSGRQGLKEGSRKEQGWPCDPETQHDQLYNHQNYSSHGFQVGSIKLTVKVGSIEFEKCDYIVNSTNSELDLTRGSVSKAITRCCGKQLSEECSKMKIKKQMKKSGLVPTASPGQRFKRILHMDREVFLKKPSEMFYQCLERVRDTDFFQSIAFPLIGRGSKKMRDSSMIAAHLVDAVVKLVKKPRKVHDVRLIVSSHQLLLGAVSIMHDKLKGLGCIQTPPKEGKKKKRGNAVTRGNRKENIPFTNPASCAPCIVADEEGWSNRRRSTGSESLQAVSLFIFSDSKKARQDAVDDIQSGLEKLLGGRSPCPTGNQNDLPPLIYPEH